MHFDAHTRKGGVNYIMSSTGQKRHEDDDADNCIDGEQDDAGDVVTDGASGVIAHVAGNRGPQDEPEPDDDRTQDHGSRDVAVFLDAIWIVGVSLE